MTTDDGITDDEQYAAACRYQNGFLGRVDPITAFMAGAEWARDYLAAQEPTDAEVEEAARVIFMAGPSTDGTIAAWDGYPEHVKARCLGKAREALSAARATRRDEEKR